MLSTPDGDSTGPQRHHHCRHGGSTARTIRRRRRTVTRAFTHQAGFSPRPTTLWPFADADQLPGTARLAGWLGRVIVTLVTGYTRPGDRVLLLNPPTSSRRGSTFRATRDPDPYAGLSEAVWTVIRLGRGVDTSTAATAPAYPEISTTAPDRPAVESGSGLRLRRPDPHTSADDPYESDSRAVCVECRSGDRFDLVITVVHPHDTDWLEHTDWNTVLTSTGTIAAVTRSDIWDSRLADPIRAIVGTFRNRGWRWHDHIAVLTEHLHTPPSAPTAPTSTAALKPVHAATSDVEHLPIHSVHHDLLLFVTTPPEDHTRRAAPGEASDE